MGDDATLSVITSRSNLRRMGEGLEKNLIFVGGILTTIVALGATFESYTNLNLIWRLLITAIAAALILWGLAKFLAGWARPAAKPLKYGQRKDNVPRLRLFLCGMAILLLTVIFVALAWFQTERFIMRLDERRSADATHAELFAPLRSVENVLIQLPG